MGPVHFRHARDNFFVGPNLGHDLIHRAGRGDCGSIFCLVSVPYWAMHDASSCPRCRKSGFVRIETVVKGGKVHRACYCGSCNHAWEIAENGVMKPHAEPVERPDRSRRPLT